MVTLAAPQSYPASRVDAGTRSSGAQLERVAVQIFEDSDTIALEIARRIRDLVEEHRSLGKPLVLGLPTGSTPIGVYRNLIQMNREGLDLSDVVTFNLDEFYPMNPDRLQSYHRFMWENFFAHVNIQRENIHLPRGDLPRSEVETHCLDYEQAISEAGGIDLMLLGIGRSGHVGFNEPGSGRDTRTRLILLDEITRKDAASDFFAEEHVPREAITMGVGTIMDAREIILIATGEHKAAIVRRAVEEEPGRHVTASYLQEHSAAAFYVDRAAAGELTREKTPWLVREIVWSQQMAKRAVLWLSEMVDKAILRLEASDFYLFHLHELLASAPGVDALCHAVFEDLRQRIRYRDALPKGERIIVFSPHPDDDVISMGGTLEKLAANGNEIVVAYMTNGSVAVFDADVRRVLRFAEMSHDVLGYDERAHGPFEERKQRIIDFLTLKNSGDVDSLEIQRLKAHIRYAEAISAIEVLGLGEKNARFLDMPFYRTGTVRKAPIGQADIDVVLDLLGDMQPAHVFVAGDLSDPHGTHRMCYAAVEEALKRHANEADAPTIWSYRGAWQEWEVHRADIFVPLSKADLDRKIEAIFKHESQKDRAMFPGPYDEREFWQRARDRNRETAATLERLGLPAFYAAEAFVINHP